MPASTKLLDPEVIARLHGLKLRARQIAAGSISGMHRSAFHGFSVEFAEHRQYTPGDDVRYIDWRIFGRADRLYVKNYEEETNLRCNLLVDTSSSMRYGAARGRMSKFDYARRLAASLAYVLISQQDAVGLITFDEQVRQHLPSATGRTQLANLVQVLETAECAGRTRVKVLFHQLAEELRKRSMVILISDLLADADAVIDGLAHIAHAGHELIVLHVMDHDEWEFPFVENVKFEGLEDTLELMTDPQALRASYLAALERYVQRVKSVCLQHKADYVPVNTRDPLATVLTGYLARRSGLAGGGRR